MRDEMYALLYLRLISVYHVRGITHAIRFGVAHGMTSDDVIGVIDLYERYVLAEQVALFEGKDNPEF